MLSKEEYFDHFLEIRQKLWFYILSFRGDRDAAKDILSEAFLAGYRDREKLRVKAAFPSWMMTLTRRIVLKENKKTCERPKTPEFTLDDFASANPDPEETANLNCLLAALDELPDEQKEALLLTAIQGFSYSEAARISATNENTIRVRIYRGRKKLKEILQSKKQLIEEIKEVSSYE